VLSFFGISIPVVQVGGGLIVISTGWAMLNQKDDTDRSTVSRAVSCTHALRDAFYPLTLPLTVGPRLDLGCDYAGRKRTASLESEPAGDTGAAVGPPSLR